MVWVVGRDCGGCSIYYLQLTAVSLAMNVLKIRRRISYQRRVVSYKSTSRGEELGVEGEIGGFSLSTY